MPPKNAPTAPTRHGAEAEKALKALGYTSGEENAEPPKKADPPGAPDPREKR